MDVIAVVALCAVALISSGLVAWARLRRAVRVRIVPADGGYAATFAPPRKGQVFIVEDSVMFLSETGNGGDGLLTQTEDAQFATPVEVRFVSHPPGHKMEFGDGAVRLRPLLPGQGGAAWIRYRGERVGAEGRPASALVLWEKSARAKGKKPKVLRGAYADRWIYHLMTPQSPAPISLPVRIGTAITPAWLRDPENRAAVNVVLLIAGVVAALVLTLVFMDVRGLRSVVPLSSEYDWLGFAGGLLGGVAGGVMTLAGVMLTLRKSAHAENQRQQDESMRMRLSVMPLLDVKISDDVELFDNSRGQLAGMGWLIIPLEPRSTDLTHIVEHRLALIIQNIGLGHARIRYVTVDRRGDHGAVSRIGDFGQPDGMLQIGQQQVTRMSLAQSSQAVSGSGVADEHFLLTLRISYEDLLGNRYRQGLDVSLFAPLAPAMQPAVTPLTAHLSLGAVNPPEFAGAPDGNSYWYI